MKGKQKSVYNAHVTLPPVLFKSSQSCAGCLHASNHRHPNDCCPRLFLKHEPSCLVHSCTLFIYVGIVACMRSLCQVHVNPSRPPVVPLCRPSPGSGPGTCLSPERRVTWSTTKRATKRRNWRRCHLRGEDEVSGVFGTTCRPWMGWSWKSP